MKYINENFVMIQRHFEIDWEILLAALDIYRIRNGDIYFFNLLLHLRMGD